MALNSSNNNSKQKPDSKQNAKSQPNSKETEKKRPNPAVQAFKSTLKKYSSDKEKDKELTQMAKLYLKKVKLDCSTYKWLIQATKKAMLLGRNDLLIKAVYGEIDGGSAAEVAFAGEKHGIYYIYNDSFEISNPQKDYTKQSVVTRIEKSTSDWKLKW